VHQQHQHGDPPCPREAGWPAGGAGWPAWGAGRVYRRGRTVTPCRVRVGYRWGFWANTPGGQGRLGGRGATLPGRTGHPPLSLPPSLPDTVAPQKPCTRPSLGGRQGSRRGSAARVRGPGQCEGGRGGSALPSARAGRSPDLPHPLPG